jgi:hypothetical protein
MDLELIAPENMCVLCRVEYNAHKRGVFPVLDMEQKRADTDRIAAEYEAAGVTGPICRACTMLPVVA